MRLYSSPGQHPQSAFGFGFADCAEPLRRLRVLPGKPNWHDPNHPAGGLAVSVMEGDRKRGKTAFFGTRRIVEMAPFLQAVIFRQENYSATPPLKGALGDEDI